jgi:hypothetical protein
LDPTHRLAALLLLLHLSYCGVANRHLLLLQQQQQQQQQQQWESRCLKKGSPHVTAAAV